MYRISTILFVLFLVCASQPLFSQPKQIALHHVGEASFFTSLQAAYNAAMSGDTLYIPGGAFAGIVIEKSLALIGVGHHPDSTAGTGPTILNGMDINSGADNSFITGIFFINGINSSGNPSGVTISRCYLNNGILIFDGNQKTNWVFSENWIGNAPIFGHSIVNINSSPSNFLLSNNIFHGPLGWNYPFYFSEFTNNVFFHTSVWAINSNFNNNVFGGNSLGNSTYCQYFNNLNSGVNGISGTNFGSGNYLDDIPFESVFVNYSGGNTFYQNNFHVVNPAYTGDDDAPVGIYGGLFPWKEGSLPFNPHIQLIQVQSATNPDGTLHINGAVRAQQN